MSVLNNVSFRQSNGVTQSRTFLIKRQSVEFQLLERARTIIHAQTHSGVHQRPSSGCRVLDSKTERLGRQTGHLGSSSANVKNALTTTPPLLHGA